MRFFYLLILLTASVVNAAEKDSVIVIESDADVEGMGEFQTELDGGPAKSSPIIDDAVQEAMLDPKITKIARKHFKASAEAEELFHDPTRIISKTIPVVNEPGHDATPIDVAIHYGATITFKNTNGELLFVERYMLGNKDVVAVDDGSGEGEGEGKEASPFLTLTNERTLGYTNMHVWLVNSRNPLSFYIKIVEQPDVYADRIDVVVVNPGESSHGPELKLATYDALTLVMNNRKPIEGAEKVKFDSPVVTGWKHGQTMWIRTSERMIFPSHSPDKVLSSDSVYGVNVYQVTNHPIIHLVDKNGQFIKVTAEGDSHG